MVSGKKEVPIEELSSDGASPDSDAPEEEDLAGEDFAREQRKKTGLPELELDALPSAIANRMLILDICFNIWYAACTNVCMYLCVYLNAYIYII